MDTSIIQPDTLLYREEIFKRYPAFTKTPSMAILKFDCISRDLQRNVPVFSARRREGGSSLTPPQTLTAQDDDHTLLPGNGIV